MSECPFQSRLSAFHDRELDAPAAAELESHLPGCPECSQALAGIRAVSRLISGAGTGQLSQLGVARLHATADAASRRRDMFPFMRALLAAAASVLVIGGAWLYETPAPTSSGPSIVVKPSTEKEADWERLASGEKLSSPQDLTNDTGVAFSDWMLRSLEGNSGL